MNQKPLYRKVNTRTHGVHHRFGGDYRDERQPNLEDGAEGLRASMHGRQRRGLDYTPLFRFLLSRVGEPWEPVLREAAARLDRVEPIFWLVARSAAERRDCVRIGEASYYSGLYVDACGRLQLVNPSLTAADLVPGCRCCTHTFNGVRLPVRDSPPGPASSE